MSYFDQYASLFSPGGIGAPPTVAAPAAVAPVAQAAPAGQPNPLDIIKALSGLVHRDPLGEVARANANSNKMHTLDEWHALFAPSHVQSVAPPITHVAPPVVQPAMHPALQNFLSLFGNSQVA